MRTVCSTGTTKILPSPICPVFGSSNDGVDGLVDHLAGTNDFDLDLRKEVHGVFRAPIDFRYGPFWRPYL